VALTRSQTICSYRRLLVNKDNLFHPEDKNHSVFCQWEPRNGATTTDGLVTSRCEREGRGGRGVRRWGGGGGQREVFHRLVRSAGECSSSYSFLRRSLLGFYEAKMIKLHFVHCACPLPLTFSLVHHPPWTLSLAIMCAAYHEFRHDKHHRFPQGFSVRSIFKLFS